MNENNALWLLKNEIDQIMKNNPSKSLSKLEREIFHFEEELRELGLDVEVEANLAQLRPELENLLFNKDHQFYGKDYLLRWIKPSDKAVWSLYVLNTKSSGLKKLIDCPEMMKKECLVALPVFAAKISDLLNQD